ncbi:hypothetical protein MMC30_001151 [Trapelia coarctata]|nr:hypothetical protein [Trapelia coarctata]
MYICPLLLTLLSSLALTHAIPYADADPYEHDLHARNAHAHHKPNHDLQARHAYHAALYARNLQIKALHKRLWYSPICTAPPPSPPESPRASGGEKPQTPSPPGAIPIPGPGGIPLGSSPPTGSVPRSGSLGRMGSVPRAGSLPRPGLSRSGSSGFFMQGEQLVAYCRESCTCKKLGQFPAELINFGSKHCASRCFEICHCGESR